MNRILRALLVVAPLVAACAGATQSSAASPALASASGKSEKVICQTEKPLGSNIARTVCRTQEQMDAERQATQDGIRAMPKSGPTPRH